MTAFTREELNALFALCGEELHRFLATRVQCAETAADLAQEAYLRLERLAPQGHIDNLRAYLFRIAANLANDHLRARSRNATLLQVLEEEQVNFEVTPSPESEFLVREELIAFQRAIDELPQRTRQIIYLSRFEELTHSEIARRLGVSKSTVEKSLAQALDFIRERLDRLS